MLVDDLVSRSMLEEHHLLEQPKPRVALFGTIAVHILLFVFVLVAPPSVSTPRSAPEIIAKARQITPLIAPPVEMTQKAPNKGKPATELNLQGLLSRPSVATPPPTQPGMTRPAAPKQFSAPVSAAPAPAAPKPIEAPKLEEKPRDVADVQAKNLPGLGVQVPPPPVQPPRIQAEEQKPKLAFERPGANSGSPNAQGVGASGKIPLPQPSTVEAATRQVARAGGAGLTVGDIGEGTGGLGESLNLPNAPLKNGSALELLSDPMGVDFRPYLIRILSSVRRNWLAVIPESARLGRRGKVLIQFAINRDGSVPKLVIATPSGTESFDRAAVAGISASNPFPPLPDEFRGPQVRLQFTFLYNTPKR
ncbi:MAG: TonB C-terminal domain-containing protein [Bryobacterales bacterium]|nr:TonB C-terminal domain-containing protein [Bryobacterales bacterium]